MLREEGREGRRRWKWRRMRHRRLKSWSRRSRHLSIVQRMRSI